MAINIRQKIKIIMFSMKYSVKLLCQTNLNYTTSCNVWLMRNLIEESNICLLHTILRLTNQNECVTNVAQLLCVYSIQYDSYVCIYIDE